MINKIFLVVSLFNLCLILYGILITIINTEENLCKMTYMYEYPQFVKIKFKENDDCLKYNLYAYSEGHLTEKARNMQFSGAPVLFIPGNCGSYKQVRSLASVALRKGIDNNWIQHLDYYTVDLNEEHSGLFGGVLAEQTDYIEKCIKIILKLYEKLPNAPKQLILVGHSMGGKIAQALATSPDISNSVNTIISIATPMDRPVLSLDYYGHSFYNKVNSYWSEHRGDILQITNETNTCCSAKQESVISKQAEQSSTKNLLKDKLLVSIGGGSRDILVHPGLAKSKFSDINTMATNIPNVWLTTDHQCSVWCLQLVLVVNRFLYSIIQPNKQRGYASKGQSFIENKTYRFMQAQQHFVNKFPETVLGEQTMVEMDTNDIGDWTEDPRRVFTEQFKTGINRTRVQMIRLTDTPQFKFLKVEAINMDNEDWVFGCSANEVNKNSRFCSKATSLAEIITKFPSLRHERSVFQIDLHSLKKKNPTWTHVLLRILPSKDPFQYNIDIFNPSDREITISMPKWYSFSSQILLDDTILGSTFYSLKLSGMEETYQTLSLNLQTRSCSKEFYHTVGKICVPWTKGFDRYHFFTKSRTSPMYLYAPEAKPNGYNSTKNPVTVELHLDPSCRYTLSVHQSLGVTMARIVQQFSNWLPAHLVAIILLSFKHQISLTPKNEIFKCGKLHSALCKCTPFFIITASRVFAKFILWFKFLPIPESYDFPILVSVLIHGSALAILTLFTAGIWAAICFCGNFAHKILYKLISLPIPSMSSAMVKCIEKFPISAGVLLVSIALVSCGGIALICGSVIYFILLTKMYEDYLENFVFKTAKMIAKKLFGGHKKTCDEKNEGAEKSDAKSKDALSDEDHSRLLESPEAIAGTEEENEVEAALDKLLQESLGKQKEHEKEKNKEILAQRVEYDGVHDGLSNINFHLPLLFLIIIMSVLNLPSTITWAKNYKYAPTLRPDPSLLPGLIVIVCSSVIWQLPTPRNVIGYNFFSSVCYVAAVACVLYCQESIYRLNFIIAAIFLLITLHQIASPTFKPKPKEEQSSVEQRLERIKQFIDETKTGENL